MAGRVITKMCEWEAMGKNLRLQYIEGLKWETIACEMNYNWKYIHELHSKILRKVLTKTYH